MKERCRATVYKHRCNRPAKHFGEHQTAIPRTAFPKVEDCLQRELEQGLLKRWSTSCSFLGSIEVGWAVQKQKEENEMPSPETVKNAYEFKIFCFERTYGYRCNKPNGHSGEHTITLCNTHDIDKFEERFEIQAHGGLLQSWSSTPTRSGKCIFGWLKRKRTVETKLCGSLLGGYRCSRDAGHKRAHSILPGPHIQDLTNYLERLVEYGYPVSWFKSHTRKGSDVVVWEWDEQKTEGKKMQRFWIVKKATSHHENLGGANYPSKKYRSIDAARERAMELAGQSNVDYIVLEVVDAYGPVANTRRIQVTD